MRLLFERSNFEDDCKSIENILYLDPVYHDRAQQYLATLFQLDLDYIRGNNRERGTEYLSNDNMEYCYSIKEDKKKPVYKNPITVYIVELTIPAYILLVEEEDNVHVGLVHILWHLLQVVLKYIVLIYQKLLLKSQKPD